MSVRKDKVTDELLEEAEALKKEMNKLIREIKELERIAEMRKLERLSLRAKVLAQRLEDLKAPITTEIDKIQEAVEKGLPVPLRKEALPSVKAPISIAELREALRGLEEHYEAYREIKPPPEIEKGELCVNVLTMQDLPIARASVKIEGSAHGYVSEKETNEDGVACFRDIPFDEYRITVLHDEYVGKSEMVKLDSKLVSHVIRLERKAVTPAPPPPTPIPRPPTPPTPTPAKRVLSSEELSELPSVPPTAPPSVKTYTPVSGIEPKDLSVGERVFKSGVWVSRDEQGYRVHGLDGVEIMLLDKEHAQEMVNIFREDLKDEEGARLIEKAMEVIGWK